jgi:hypothetical protein
MDIAVPAPTAYGPSMDVKKPGHKPGWKIMNGLIGERRENPFLSGLSTLLNLTLG